ncbi:hypothetical protein PTSG_00238 [Salpingoeca rosetta]|uniref:JmjC domain-containing protein n=1 Tax=Salpingoeca rosetta (strain ATCC 50818 / BSB-021) TaxID=946362 RepID=F2TVX1_SALR5|nr:uncharacterized protein PTSG_00238 [Salpingoeca rosetta]EGD72217.1 hypothetical protein PTSG_00238 [Salpingoeca rosetta]|eukprot:XP_004998788.1 hypothetical protein PTSG_00238 [Salpingoeca rosetta]
MTTRPCRGLPLACMAWAAVALVAVVAGTAQFPIAHASAGETGVEQCSDASDSCSGSKPSVRDTNVFLQVGDAIEAADAARNATPWWANMTGKAQLHLHFATPIYRTNIHKYTDPDVVNHINQALADVIVDRWNTYVDSLDLAKNVNMDRRTYNEVNNGFYERQFNMLEGLREMNILKSFWDINVAKFIGNLPGDEPDKLAFPSYINPSGGNSYAYWATVSKWGIDHQAHVHFGSAVSGVYYVRTPALSGELKFPDPRGFPKFPFERAHYMAPVAGDLVLFPGWMPHTVLPTAGKEPRVAIAFNLQAPPEAWHDTIFVHTMQELE